MDHGLLATVRVTVLRCRSKQPVAVMELAARGYWIREIRAGRTAEFCKAQRADHVVIAEMAECS